MATDHNRAGDNIVARVNDINTRLRQEEYSEPRAMTSEPDNWNVHIPRGAVSTEALGDIYEIRSSENIRLVPGDGGTVVVAGALMVEGTNSGGNMDYSSNLYAVPMDGVTDAQPSLQAVLNSDKYVRFPPNSVIALNNPINIPTGRIIDANNVTFKMLRPVATFAVVVNSNVRINGHMTLDSKDGDTAGFELVGNDIYADSLHARCATGMGGVIGDGAVLSRSFGGLKTGLTARDAPLGNVHIGRLEVTGFEFAVTFAQLNGVKVGNLEITRYRRGLYIDDSTHVWIDGGLISVAAPNAAPNPGHNGVIIEASAHEAAADIHFNNLVVRDAGEHGWRLGGAYRIRRVWFNECSAINSGRGGFKVLGGEPMSPQNYHEDIWFNDCFVEDAGNQETNSGGIMIGYARRVQINNPIIRAKGVTEGGKQYACGFGIHIIGSFDVVTTNPIVKDSMFAAYCVEYTKGDQMNITLVGGQLHAHTEAIRIDWTVSGTEFRHVTVTGYPTLSVTGTGYAVNLVESGTLGGSTGTLYNTCNMAWQSGLAATKQVTGNGAYRMLADVKAPGFDPAVVLRNGSTWVDVNSGARRNMSVGTWTLQ